MPHFSPLPVAICLPHATAYRFLFDGNRINDADTPESLEMVRPLPPVLAFLLGSPVPVAAVVWIHIFTSALSPDTCGLPGGGGMAVRHSIDTFAEPVPFAGSLY